MEHVLKVLFSRPVPFYSKILPQNTEDPLYFNVPEILVLMWCRTYMEKVQRDKGHQTHCLAGARWSVFL